MTTLVYKREKPVPKKKVERVQRLVELFEKYDKIIIFDFHDVPANLMKQIRMKLREKAEVIVVKNTLVKKALEKIIKKKPYLKHLERFLTGMRAFAFTNNDVFEIARIIDNVKEKTPAKPGKIAPFDIIIPKGNTGLKPGPAMTDLRLANVPIRIIEGELWVMQDTLLVKRGQRISSQAAKVLQLLDIIPFETKPKVIAAIDRDLVISGDTLLIPFEQYIEYTSEAINTALNISIETTIPLPETAEIIISKAFTETLAIATYSDIPIPENIEQIIAKTTNITIRIISEMIKIDPQSVPDDLKSLVETSSVSTEEKEEKKEEKKKEEKKKEKKEEKEEEFSGLAALFG